MSGSIINILSWIYQWLIAQKITKIYSLEVEYGGSVELTCISHSFNNYIFSGHYKNSSSTVDDGIETIDCHLLFSGNCHDDLFNAL